METSPFNQNSKRDQCKSKNIVIAIICVIVMLILFMVPLFSIKERVYQESNGVHLCNLITEGIIITIT
jgi:hypothetical protein